VRLIQTGGLTHAEEMFAVLSDPAKHRVEPGELLMLREIERT